MTLRIAKCLCGPRAHARPQPVLLAASRVADAKPGSRGRADPTGTSQIVRRWNRDLDARWATLKRLMPRAVQDRVDPVAHIHTSYLTGQPDPVVAFQGWLDEAMRQIVLGINGAWLLPYVRNASDVGSLHARTSVKAPTSDQAPADRTHILQSLAITELQGILEATSQQAVRAFANGYLARKTPAAISAAVRQVIDSVGRQRSQLLTSFMAVRAHAAATLDGLRALGVTRVGLVPERASPTPRLTTDAKSKRGMVAVLTAEDDRVCPVCEEIAQDGPYYIDEAEALIPAHPRCRCAFVPADADEYEEFAEDAFNPDQPRDDKGRWSAEEAVANLHKLPEVTGSERHFDPSFGGKDYGPEVTVRSAGFERTPENWITKSVTSPTLGRVPLDKVVINQSAATKGLVEKYIRNPPQEPVDFVEHEGKFYATSGTHRLVAAKMRGLETISARIFQLKGSKKKKRVKDSQTHVAAGVMITADDTGRTLFVRRKSGDQPGTWAFPGGAVEPGETIDGAAARETREEIGYDPSADLEQGHRGDWNGVDFTTFMHNADREFRPHMNHEHDAYKWALVEQAPEPLHPGVERTLDAMDRALRMRDESTWNEGDHPRDKTGKFTEKGVAGSAAEKLAKGGWHSHMIAEGDLIGNDSNKPVFEVPSENVAHFKAHAAENGIELEEHGSLNYENSHYGFSAKEAPKSVSEPTPAPPPEHPLEKHLSKVSGTSSERVAMRAQMKGLKHNDPKLAELQARHNASFWKQHQQLTKQGKLEQAKDIADKLDKYSKSYGISNPLKTAPPKSSTSSAPKTLPIKTAKDWNVNKPDENFAKSLEEQGVPFSHGTFGPNSPHAGQQYVAFGSTSDTLKTLVSQIAKYHPNMEPISESSTIYKPKLAPSVNSLSALQTATAMKKDLHDKFGKVANIDEHSLQSHVIISTSTLHAKEMAEVAAKYPEATLQTGMKSTYWIPKVAPPQPSSVAPKPTFGKAEPKPSADALNFSDLKKVGEQKGSNPGGVYEDASGNQYYVKSMSRERADNELLAAKLYALAGSPTLNYVPVKPDGDTHYVATKFEKLDQNNVSQLSPAQREQAQQHFATHAWLANWDAAGTGGDNQGAKGGLVKTLDVGGALEFRAKGTPKGDAFGTSVGEFDSMRKGPSSDNNALFGKMTDDQIKASVTNRLDPTLTFDKGDIERTVASVYGEGTQKTKDLTEKLAARQADLVKRADALGKAPTTTDLSHMSDEEQRVHWLKKTLGTEDEGYLTYHTGEQSGAISTKAKQKVEEMGLTPAELGFIRAFTGPSSSVNKEMRDGVMNEHVFAFKHIMNEALDKFPVYDGDKVWRKINLDETQQALYVPGKIVHWQAFSSTSKNPDTWSGNTHFTIHNPKSGRDVQFISENPSEAEVIMPADTYYRVLSKKSSYGDTHIELEEVIPFGKKKKKAA